MKYLLLLLMLCGCIPHQHYDLLSTGEVTKERVRLLEIKVDSLADAMDKYYIKN